MNLRELATSMGLYFRTFFESQDLMPCYAWRITVPDEVNSKARILKLLQVAKKEAFDEDKSRMTIFSVTEKDKHHKLWLEVAEEKKLTVLKVKSRHGNYWCWMIVQIKTR